MRNESCKYKIEYINVGLDLLYSKRGSTDWFCGRKLQKENSLGFLKIDHCVKYWASQSE